MADIPSLIKDLALILMVAGAVTLLFKSLRQPLVLGYVVAGFLVSPHLPLTMSVADVENIHLWADIGVMFLLFSLGLDFSFKKILKMGASPIIATISTISSMLLLGIGTGRLFGWESMDCIFLGGMVAMSSTTIIYKAFDDLGLRQQRFAGIVMSVLILEDIMAIVMMVMLSAIASGSNPDGGMMLNSVLKIGFFLVLWFVVGIFAIPLFLRSVRRLINNEVLLIVSLGLCCGMAVISTQVGFSSAFGAFVMGSILAETVEAEKIIRLVEPVKNLFGAIFFVSVGMLVDPAILVEYAVPIILLVLTILLGQAIFGSYSFLISGQSLKSAMQCGFSMAQIGEFSFIIASLGLSLGVIGDFLYPVVVAVSVITTFLTPYMIRASVPCYNHLERHLPKSWIIRLNNLTLTHASVDSGENLWKSLLVQLLRIVLIYGILSVAIVLLMFSFILPFAISILPKNVANISVGLLTVLAVSPFLRAMMMKKNHSEEFRALWKVNLANRILLTLTIVVRIAIATSFVYYICAYMVLLPYAVELALAFAFVVFMIFSRRLKRSSIGLERMFIQNLRSRDIEAQVRGHRRPLYEGHLLDRDIHISDIDVPEDSLWAGRTLGELRFGNQFGIHVSSILRGRQRINIPGGETILFPGDRVQAIGSDEQLTAFSSAMQKSVQPDDPDIEKREMRIRHVIITSSSPFIGKRLKESGIREHYGCMVVGIEEGRENLSHPDPDHVFQKGDIVWVVGEKESLDRLNPSPNPSRGRGEQN